MAHIETKHIITIHDLIEDWIRSTAEDEKFNLDRSYGPWLEFEQSPSYYTLGNLLDKLRTIVPERSLVLLEKAAVQRWDEIYGPTAAVQKPFAGSHFLFRMLALDGKSWLLHPAPASTAESPFRSDVLRRILDILDSDNQIVVITGCSYDELHSFIIRPLGAFFDSERVRYNYVSTTAETAHKGNPEIIIVDWTKEMSKNTRLIAELKSHLMASSGNRLIIVCSIASTIINYAKALGLMPFIEDVSPASLRRVPAVGLLPQFLSAWQAADELFMETTAAKIGAAKVILSRLPALPFIINQLKPRLKGDFTQEKLEKAVSEIERSIMGDQKTFIYSGGRIEAQSEPPQNIYYAKEGYEVFYLQTGKGEASIPPASSPNLGGTQGILSGGFSMAVGSARYVNNFSSLWASPIPSVLLAHFLLH
jgi:hypothetical protein